MPILGNAITLFFKDCLFTHQEDAYVNEIKKTVVIIFNPTKRKYYCIDEPNFNDFINKNYPSKQIIKRAPSLYCFQIPFPNIEFVGDNTWEDRFKLSISKFHKKTYQPLESYIVRLKLPTSLDFRQNSFDPIFQVALQNVINLSEAHNKYLSFFLNMNQSLIDSTKLIMPFYKLSKEEIISITKMKDKLMQEMNLRMNEEMEENSRQEMAADYERYWTGAINDMNREAFENDPSNIWNVD